jgi:outer membrane protein, heavy metal efflux system
MSRNADVRGRIALRARATGVAVMTCVFAAGTAEAQDSGSTSLRDLLIEARGVNAEVQVARRAADAAAARIPQAGALPDPMLSAGLMYVPVPSFDVTAEGMTMGIIQLGQRLPPAGSRAAREGVARQFHQVAVWEALEVELEVLTRLKSAYFEALFIDRALDVLSRNRALLVDFAEVARSRFAVGRAPQQDVLRAQTEITRLDEQLAGLQSRRTAAAAEINAILQRSPTEPLVASYPERVRTLALAPPTLAAFTAAALEGGLGEGVPSLAELRRRAIEGRPMLRAHEHRIVAAREGVRLAEAERFPDLEVMLGYGTRWGQPDMLSASVSVPLPVFAARKQRQAVLEAGHELASYEVGHHQMAADIESDVATRYAALVRTREQILLLSDGVIPQARATIESAAAAYQAGRVEFMSLLDAQATLFRNEIELARQLSDFGRELAALERAVGQELFTEEAP